MHAQPKAIDPLYKIRYILRVVATLEALTSPNLVATLAVILDFTKIYKSGSFKPHLSPSV